MKIGIGRNLKALFAPKNGNVAEKIVKDVRKDAPKMKELKNDVFSFKDLPYEMHPDSPTFNWDKSCMF